MSCGCGLGLRGMTFAGTGVIIDVVRPNGPNLPSMFISDGHKGLAVDGALIERLNPALFWRGLVGVGGQSAFVVAACALDQQGSQMGIAIRGNGAQFDVPAGCGLPG